MQEVKVEKRRLNDLLTMREEEAEKWRDSEKKWSKKVGEKEGIIGEMERKIKHMEKKYDK
jgi:hypothetical protein